MAEDETRRNFSDATGWLIFVPPKRQTPGGYGAHQDEHGWQVTVFITSAACFDSHHAALRVLHAHYAHFKGARVTPCVPRTPITHTGIDALPVSRKVAPGAE